MQIWEFQWRVVTGTVPFTGLGYSVFNDHVVSYRVDTSVPNSITALTDMRAAWQSVLINAMAYSSYINAFRLFWRSGSPPSFPFPQELVTEWTVQGTHLTTLMPMQDTVTIQRRDGTVDRTGRGRFTWYPITSDFVDSSIICTIKNTHTDLVALADMLKTPVTANGVVFQPVLRHKTTPLTYSDVIETHVTQRITFRKHNRAFIPAWT